MKRTAREILASLPENKKLERELKMIEEKNKTVEEAAVPKKELTIEQILEKMKGTELEYVYKEKGKKHQYKKEGITTVSFTDRLDYVAMYSWNSETKKYDMVKLYNEKDFNDNVDIS